MNIVNRRNAVLGWAAWALGKRVLKRKAKAVVPAVDPETKRDIASLRDMIEQLLMTNPGERVNRPDFGSGLQQLVFAPNSPELAAALQFTIRATLQQWLGDVIEVQGLDVTSSDSSLIVNLQYTLRSTHEAMTEQFVRPL